MSISAKTVAEVALPILRDLKERERRYYEDVAEWHKQGYRAHYCPHGMNLWVDYDAICPGCEDGITVYEEALDRAHGIIRRTLRRMEDTASFLIEQGNDLPNDLAVALMEWAWHEMPDNYEPKEA